MKFELKFRDDELRKALTASYKKVIREAIIANAENLEEAIKERYATEVRKTPEYKSLRREAGGLRKDFGIEEPDSALADVIDVLLRYVKVTINRATNDNNNYIVPMTIVVFDQRSLKGLLSSNVGSYFSDGNSRWSGEEIPWLRWLLTSGNTPVVVGYTVFYGEYSDEQSRTGHAIMVDTNVSGKSFTVDPRYRGTAERNFLTRAAREVVPHIKGLIQDKVIGKIR